MILPNDTTVAVADGHRLRLLRNRAAEPHVDLVELDAPDIDAENQGSGGRHRSTGANPDASRLAEDDFAAAVAEWLNRQVLDGTIAKLLVIADPRTLGEMRRHFHAALKAVLVDEIAKDYAGQSAEAIGAALLKA